MLKKIIIVHIFIMTILTISSLSLSAQNVLPPNFSNIKVDDLSEAQVRKFLLQVDATGLDDSKIEQVARSRGMKPEEINKLKKRIETIRKSENIKNRSNKLFGNSNKDSSLKILDSTTLAEKALLELKGKIFGLDLFKSNKITFEPNLRIATPINYQIGPDDVLQLQLYGYSEVNYSLKVSSEGNITIPNIGVVSLLNNTIEQAKEKIKIKMSAIYAGLKTGKTSIYLTLDAIRSIKVIITGEVENPGTYTIPSVSTVFNALYFSGGPTENGTLREIELIRSGIKIASIDFYDFLIKGDLKNGLRLQDQDVILVSNYKNRVELIGEVKKPGIFEIKSGETLKDVISFSGGFTENAFNERIKVLRNTSSDRKIVDVLNYNLDQFIPQSGDKYYVDEILNRYQNRVTINGAVLRPGQYELDSGMTISELIKKAQGLREDAFLNIATINRTRDDLQQELINFDLLHDTTTMNLLLRKEDIVNISSIFDIKEEYNIKLIGQLIYGDTTLKYIEGMTLEDAIFKAGGLSDAASYKKISISRRVKNSNPFSTSANIAEVIEIELNENFKKSISNFKLKPFDIIIVRAVSGYEIQKNVKVEGEVLFPGLYTIQKKK